MTVLKKGKLILDKRIKKKMLKLKKGLLDSKPKDIKQTKNNMGVKSPKDV